MAVFQPHTYTRTRDFYKDFARSFFDADILVITDVYPAREAPIEGITGKIIADAAMQFGHKNVHYIESMDNLKGELIEIIREGDILITLGAGNIWKLSDELLI